MAVYVKMIKKFDDEKRVVYQFGPNEKQMGEIEFDKEKKIFNILNQVNDSRISNQAYENWASESNIKLCLEMTINFQMLLQSKVI